MIHLQYCWYSSHLQRRWKVLPKIAVVAAPAPLEPPRPRRRNIERSFSPKHSRASFTEEQKKLPEKKEVQTSDAHHDDQQKLAGYRFARFEVRCK
ncbi:unnamed protein product [Sphagnum jensenii]|uniref:Uncharacterized protein n=1 Tax=Sphagnum jensenii TaxID=128206 RepID=A0ABP1ADK3_9BRYO